MTFWNTLSLTLIGFLLSGVVGTWITYVWQSRNWRYQQEYNRSRELLTHQIRIVEELSDLIGYRRFRMFRAAAALRSKNKDRISSSWKLYDDSVIKWNDSINSYITKLRQFFDKRAQYDLDIYITPGFSSIGGELEALKRRFDREDFGEDYVRKLQKISIEIEDLGAHSNSFIGLLWKHIDGLKKDLDGTPPISFENHKRLSRWYLFKHMFELRVKS